MNFDVCKIYRGKKLIGILPCKFIEKTAFRDEHFLISDTYQINPGYMLLINENEKLYVLDVRRQHSQNSRIEVYFETVAQHKDKVLSKRKVNLSLFIAFLSLVVSFVALIKSFFTM